MMLIISNLDLNNVIAIICFNYLLHTDCGETLFVNGFHVVFILFFQPNMELFRIVFVRIHFNKYRLYLMSD